MGRLLAELQLIDKLYEIEKGNRKSYSHVASELQNTKFDLVVCPHESLTSAMLVRKISAATKIGFWNWWNLPFFNNRIRKNSRLPEALRQLSLLAPLWPEVTALSQQFLELQDKEILASVPDWASAKIPVPHADELRLRMHLTSKYICLFPGSVWATKKWTEEGFIEVGKRYSQKGYIVLVLGGKGEESLCENVAAKIGGAQNLCGQTSLLETVKVLQGADLVFSNDSGGQHLAALVGAPTVSVFGPTILPFGYRPWNSKVQVVQVEGLPCRPCGKHGHQQCPIGTHECMKKIAADSVIKAGEDLLALNP